MHWNTQRHEEHNTNKALRIELLKPLPRSQLKKRRGVRLESPLLKRTRRRNSAQDDEQLNLGNLAALGTDNLFEIFSRVDVSSLLSCLRVNKSLFTFITSPSFRRSWRGKNGVLIGSRTIPWCLLTLGEQNYPFPPLNNPSSAVRGEVLASAGGLLCVNVHSSNNNLELAVGNPLTQEWVLLPVPEREFPITSRMSYRMEALRDGHFKVAAYERANGLYRVFVYDSGSESWGVTELHYPGFSSTKWSDYDLTRGRWRTRLTTSGDRYFKTGSAKHSFLSHPFDHGFCVWEHKSTSYFASPWVSLSNASITGYGVWKLDLSTGELSLVSARMCEELFSYDGFAAAVNDREHILISCNALESLVCFMGESLLHPAVPVVFFDVDSRVWAACEAAHPDHAPQYPPAPDIADLVKAYDHYSVAVVYSPSLLAPAQSCSEDGKRQKHHQEDDSHHEQQPPPQGERS